MSKDYLLIGIDGGATKVSGWGIDVSGTKFSLANLHSEEVYSDFPGYIKGFKVVDIQIQLSEYNSGNIKPTDQEIDHGNAYIQATVSVINKLVELSGQKRILVGIGMPGLKTNDQRGISVMANGPRNINFCDKLEKLLHNSGIEFIKPIEKLGSDAFYCGLGEEYADKGQFKEAKHSYYLGGGTGAADALKLAGKLVSLDDIKPWFAKAWEMQNSDKISMEKCASAKGIESLYSEFSGIDREKNIKDKIFPPQIHDMALNNIESAVKTFDTISINLADLIYERITTIFTGWQGIFEFINPNKPAMEKTHKYQGTLLDSVIIGQRLGDLFKKAMDDDILWNPFFTFLSKRILESDCLNIEAKQHYCPDGNFSKSLFKISKLREAPALGAGIDAYLTY